MYLRLALWLCLLSLENYLHPEKEPFGASFKLQHIDPSSGALVHPLELTVIREDDQVLNEDIGKMLTWKKQTNTGEVTCRPSQPTSSTFPVVRSFQQKWMRESSVCWMYTWPLRLSGVTVLPFMVILPARNSTRYLLEEPREPDTMLGNKAPEAMMKRGTECCKDKREEVT